MGRYALGMGGVILVLTLSESGGYIPRYSYP